MLQTANRPHGETECSVFIITFNHSSSPLLCSLNYFYFAIEDLKFAPRNTAKTARRFASDVLAWVTAREYVVVNRCIDSTVIDWPLE